MQRIRSSVFQRVVSFFSALKNRLLPRRNRRRDVAYSRITNTPVPDYYNNGVDVAGQGNTTFVPTIPGSGPHRRRHASGGVEMTNDTKQDQDDTINTGQIGGQHVVQVRTPGPAPPIQVPCVCPNDNEADQHQDIIAIEVNRGPVLITPIRPTLVPTPANLRGLPNQYIFKFRNSSATYVRMEVKLYIANVLQNEWWLRDCQELVQPRPAQDDHMFVVKFWTCRWPWRLCCAAKVRESGTWCVIRKWNRDTKKYVKPTVDHVFQYNSPVHRQFTIDGLTHAEKVTHIGEVLQNGSVDWLPNSSY